VFGACALVADPVFDHDACRRVTVLAGEAGVGGLVALALYTAVVNPGWRPFDHVVYGV